MVILFRISFNKIAEDISADPYSNLAPSGVIDSRFFIVEKSDIAYVTWRRVKVKTRGGAHFKHPRTFSNSFWKH